MDQLNIMETCMITKAMLRILEVKTTVRAIIETESEEYVIIRRRTRLIHSKAQSGNG